METDTDLLLALLESSMPAAASYTRNELLDALVSASGSVDRAVLALSDASNTVNRKRKREPATLESHFGKTNDTRAHEKRRHLTTQPVRPSNCDAPSTLKSINLKHVPATSKSAAPPQLPPLLLMTPEMISQHTPATMHSAVLSEELATSLYYKMLEEAQNWEKNKWFLADRLVESPHTTAFYSRGVSSSDEMEEAAAYWYNGRRTGPPRKFPPEMEEAARIIEEIVREQVKKRQKYPLEFDGPWEPNVAAANCYKGSKEGVGYHSDQLTYLGPYPTIASLTLGTTRRFRLREVIPEHEKGNRKAQTVDIPLLHNTLLIMHPPMQEMYKHSIPTSNSMDKFRPKIPHPERGAQSYVERINITFRFFRSDYRSESIPMCECEKPMPAVLRSDMRRKRRSADHLNEQDYYWQCNAGAQNEGKSCKMWRKMNAQEEGRGPFVGKMENLTFS